MGELTTREFIPPEDRDEQIERLIAQLPTVVAKIDRNVESLVQLVASTNRVSLCNAIYWQKIVCASSSNPAPTLSEKDLQWFWALDYAQNLAASVPPGTQPTLVDVDAAACRFRSIVAEIMECIQRDFVLGWAFSQREGRERTPGKIDTQVFAVLDWLSMRRSRFPAHDSAFITSFLGPHDDVLRRLFEVSASDLAAGLALQVRHHKYAFTHGVARLLGLANTPLDVTALPDELAQIDAPTLLEMRNDPDLPRKLRQAVGSDFCDFQAISHLPPRFLDPLSWGPGEDMEFLAPGDFCGWPLRLTPRHKRPLLRVDGHHLCFCSDTVATTIYRNVYSCIIKKERRHKDLWNKAQHKASEGFVASLFKRMLPGARAARNYYVVSADCRGRLGPERDLLVEWDDFVGVVETKAPNFATLPPMTRFDEYDESIRAQVEAPYKQCAHVRENIEAGDIAIYEKTEDDGEQPLAERFKIRKSDVGLLVSCGVILNSFPGPASQEANLRLLLGKKGDVRFWSVDVETLMACEDLFPSPVVFLHFLEWRTRGPRPLTFAEEDLDHVMLYISHLAGEVRVPPSEESDYDFISLRSGTAAIAQLYHQQQVLGLSVGSWLDRVLEPRILELIRHLDSFRCAGRRRVGSMLLDLPKAARARLAEKLEHLIDTVTSRQDRVIFRFGKGYLLVLLAPERVRYFDVDARARGLELMRAWGHEKLTVLILTVSADGALVELRWQFLKRGDVLA